MSPTQQERNDYDAMLQQVRQQLRDEGEFDETALRLMKGIRCRVDGSRAECASTASND
jgi:hypothetical protein